MTFHSELSTFCHMITAITLVPLITLSNKTVFCFLVMLQFRIHFVSNKHWVYMLFYRFHSNIKKESLAVRILFSNDYEIKHFLTCLLLTKCIDGQQVQKYTLCSTFNILYKKKTMTIVMSWRFQNNTYKLNKNT